MNRALCTSSRTTISDKHNCPLPLLDTRSFFKRPGASALAPLPLLPIVLDKSKDILVIHYWAIRDSSERLGSFLAQYCEPLELHTLISDCLDNLSTPRHRQSPAPHACCSTEWYGNHEMAHWKPVQQPHPHHPVLQNVLPTKTTPTSSPLAGMTHNPLSVPYHFET